MTQLIRAEDAPTHKMTVKLEDGTYRVFHLTEKEAVWFADNINSVHPNIAFTNAHRHIDPNAPSFYPKRGAWLERMSRAEVEERHRRYVQSKRAEVDAEEAERAKAERSKAIRAWVKANPEEFARMEREAAERLLQGRGMYHSASKPVKQYLAHYEALRAVDELLPQHEDAGRKGTQVDSM